MNTSYKKIKLITLLFFIELLTACATNENFNETNVYMNKLNNDSELIVLAGVGDDDTYYETHAEKIFNFHTSFAQQIIKNGDQVLIFSGSDKVDDYKNAVPGATIVDLPMDDIWMRDFSLSNTTNPIKFRYSAAGQGGGSSGQTDSDAVQANLFSEIETAKLNYKKSSLINDGGNWVDNRSENVIISTKFLKDNALTESAAVNKLKNDFNINAVFIEADEQGGLEHSDGVVSFIETNKLLINAYPSDKKYAAQIRAKIKAQFPQVEILELPTPYSAAGMYDSRFGSACGLYTNALVTSKNIYLPQFDIAEDALVLKMVQKFTSKNVIPVKSAGVCKMGGGVRCMSWQLTGKNRDKFLDYISN